MSTGGKAHEHDFDPLSGWCANCNLRADGRLLGRGGDVYQTGREYQPLELQQIREGARA